MNLLFLLLVGSSNSFACGPYTRCITLNDDGFCYRAPLEKRFSSYSKEFLHYHTGFKANPDLAPLVNVNMEDTKRSLVRVDEAKQRFCDYEKALGGQPPVVPKEVNQCESYQAVIDNLVDAAVKEEKLLTKWDEVSKVVGGNLQQDLARQLKFIADVKAKQPALAKKYSAQIDLLSNELDNFVYDSKNKALFKKEYNESFASKQKEIEKRRDTYLKDASDLREKGKSTMNCKLKSVEEEFRKRKTAK